MIKIETKLTEFKNILRIIKNLNQETNFTFSPNGLFIRVVHPSNFTLATFNIKSEMFDDYNVEKEITCTLDVEMLLKLINVIGDKYVFLDIKDFTLTISNEKNKYDLKFFVGQKDDRPIPESNATSKWKVNSSEFFSLLSELSSLGSICQFIGKESLNIKIKANIVEGTSQLNCEKIESDEAKSWYGIEYFSMISDIKNIFDEIRIGFGTQSPCEIRLSNEYLNFKWMLASRVEDE